jgi:hypothetical protein
MWARPIVRARRRHMQCGPRPLPRRLFLRARLLHGHSGYQVPSSGPPRVGLVVSHRLMNHLLRLLHVRGPVGFSQLQRCDALQCSLHRGIARRGVPKGEAGCHLGIATAIRYVSISRTSYRSNLSSRRYVVEVYMLSDCERESEVQMYGLIPLHHS